MKISKYGTFGIHQEWVDQYLSDSDNFWKDNFLGTKQIPSFKAWLKDAEIIDEKGMITPFGALCAEINRDSQTLLWEVIYINLSYNSPMMRWYVSNIEQNAEYVRKSFDKLATEYFQQTFKESTITYAVQALMQSFKYSPIGEELLQCVPQDDKATAFKRLPYNDLSPEALAYSLYKYAQFNDLKMFRVSDLYRSEEMYGAYREFGINKNDLMKLLRYLHSEKNGVIVAELNMGLDHITLRDDLDSIKVLKTFVG